jgi:hypothetical protein
LVKPRRYDRSLWPATEQMEVPTTDLAKLRARLAALMVERGDLTVCQAWPNGGPVIQFDSPQRA